MVWRSFARGAAQERPASSSRDLGPSGSEPSAIASIVAHVEGAGQEAQLRALRALWDLAGHNVANRAAVVAAGGVPLLVRALGSDCERTQEAAVAVLWHLTVAASVDSFAAAGGAPHTALLHSACGAVRPGAGPTVTPPLSAHGVKTSVAAAGGIGALVHCMVHSGRPSVTQAAAGVLGNLSVDHAENRAAIAEAGGISALVGLLLGGAGAGVQKFAATALQNLAVQNEPNQARLSPPRAQPAHSGRRSCAGSAKHLARFALC